MSLMKLPEIKAFTSQPKSLSFDTRPEACQRWEPELRAKASSDNVISMYDVIGSDWDGEGVTAKRVAAALRSIGERDVVVNLNSPGGDYFEGVSIYNMLAQHKGKVTVQVVGLAASAASVIAMAGDEILMGDGSFLMIHNAWSLAIGNRHDLQSGIEMLTQIDGAMADVYAKRSGLTLPEVVGMMDRESWFNPDAAINSGLASGKLDNKDVENGQSDGKKKAKALLDTAMAQMGLPRSRRREVFHALNDGTPCAASEAAMSGAGSEMQDGLKKLNSLFK